MANGNVIYVIILDHEYSETSDLIVRAIPSSYSSAAGISQLEPGPPSVFPCSMISNISRADNAIRIYQFKNDPQRDYTGKIYELIMK